MTRTPFGQMVRGVACDVCGGAGKIPETPCETCGGSGRTRQSRTSAIEVPAGIEDGQRMRITGAGHAGEPGAPAGDLYVEVRVAEDERFEREGSDLISIVSIPATEAMLGTTVTVPTLDGERGGRGRAGHPAGHRKGPPRRSACRASTAAAAATSGSILDVFVPTNLSDEQRELAERLDETLEDGNLEPRHGERPLRPRAPGLRLIRLAVRCAPEQADLVLAELTVLAPNGVEEERGPGYVEYAIYGGEGELPELGDLDAAIAGGRVEVSATEIPDDWADRWRDFHKPLLVADRLWLRPSWEPPREGAIDVVVDPGQAFGTGAHPTTRLCLEFLCELERRRGELARRPRHRLRRPGDRRRQARLGARSRGYDHEPAAIEAAAANAAANGVELTLERINLREQLPELAPTVVANMTAPILLAVAELIGRGEPEEPPQLRRRVPPRPSNARLLRAAARRAGRCRGRLRRRRPDARQSAARTATGPPCCSVAS